ncbi:MAG: MBL fold metallo-hydrolase [Saprospiraceae bacterium]
MIEPKAFEWNPFAENTYLLADADGNCAIFDPGCYTPAEKQELKDYVDSNGLNPVALVNTHCHLDHVFGNRFVYETWGLLPILHRDEQPLLERYPEVCRMYGIPGAEPSPLPEKYLEDGDIFRVGSIELEVLLTPGHSPASLSFYDKKNGYVLAGDVLFQESIGRTDLPGGDHQTLLQSIRNRLFPLPDETVVYPGHGPATTIRHEKEYNPFL